MIQEPKVDSCRPSARRGERQRENRPALRIVRTVKRRTPTFYCREHAAQGKIRFSRFGRKYFGSKNLRPRGNQFRGLVRILVKKPAFQWVLRWVLDKANPAKRYEKVTTNYWLCLFVRDTHFRGRKFVPGADYRLLAGRRSDARLFQRCAPAGGTLRCRSKANSVRQPSGISGRDLHSRRQRTRCDQPQSRARDGTNRFAA